MQTRVESRHQEIQVRTKATSPQHPVQNEHLSIQLLEIIQIILFMMI